MVPYVNGHLFDPVTTDWTPQLAQHAALKMNRRKHFKNWQDDTVEFAKDPPVLNITQKDFVLDFSTYEPSFHVDPQEASGGTGVTVSMCPSTEYWQQKMSHTGEVIVNDYKWDGVYFD